MTSLGYHGGEFGSETLRNLASKAGTASSSEMHPTLSNRLVDRRNLISASCLPLERRHTHNTTIELASSNCGP